MFLHYFLEMSKGLLKAYYQTQPLLPHPHLELIRVHQNRFLQKH
jgi:hypothetical protein